MRRLLTDGTRWLTDSGLETTLVFLDGMALPAFAAFILADSEEGRARLRRYYREHAAVARRHGLGFVFETPTWRANRDWGARVGYDEAALFRVNRYCARMLRALAAEFDDIPTLISGQIGPRGDGYVAGEAMSVDEAADYHAPQITAFGEADLVSALTMTNVPEATGIVEAARRLGQNVAISFTTETDGRLPSGTPLGEAIEAVDAATGAYASHFMVNCAHPSHFRASLTCAAAGRIAGIRANASTLSHAELDACETLDIGDPDALGRDYEVLAALLPGLRLFGGCCGTDIRHIHPIAAAASAVPRAAAE